jgi:kinesin family member 3B
LRYADNAKQIKNKPRINEDPKDAMLREFQQEIERLRRMLEEQQHAGSEARTMVIDGREVVVPSAAAAPIVVEKIVERRVGMSEEEKAALEARLAAEKAALERAAAAERERLLADLSKTAEERAELKAVLEEAARKQAEAREQEERLKRDIQAMEEKLLHGAAEEKDKAARHEETIRRAQVELEERRRQEAALARQLEEANLVIEEQYASMAEEVEVKTKKLKKVFAKYQQARQELADQRADFQREREELLDSIRELDRQLKLRKAIADFFVPPHEVERIEALATWDEDAGEWTLPRPDLAGRKLRPARPRAFPGASRAESEFARSRRAHGDSDARFRHDNIVDLPLDPAVETTAPYEPGVRERITLLGDDEVAALKPTQQAPQAVQGSQAQRPKAPPRRS